ncbi:MarR family transcriptional regulator [Kribbella albertanoniae]|uniref:MarR family transcriptional regulator n=1 Tax=Kribbella albertanoniae TaxID=1266829 RepID=A0A4R4P819_9ACTN|nr:MarR family transcriptional regulator [Kribbella albertanoniae]TDC17040.1 MarR family transcriptional regulator [Kribbella albertanoniae]
MTTDRVDGIIAAWQDELPAALHPTSELSKRVMVLADALEQATRPVLRELGLTAAEFDVIVALRRSGAPYRQKPSDLSRNLFLSSGGTSNVINQLVRRGYVDREPDPVDGRGTQIRLTADGIKAAEEAVIATSSAHHQVWTGHPDATVQQAIGVLRTLSGLDGT